MYRFAALASEWGWSKIRRISFDHEGIDRARFRALLDFRCVLEGYDTSEGDQVTLFDQRLC